MFIENLKANKKKHGISVLVKMFTIFKSAAINSNAVCDCIGVCFVQCIGYTVFTGKVV